MNDVTGRIGATERILEALRTEVRELRLMVGKLSGDLQAGATDSTSTLEEIALSLKASSEKLEAVRTHPGLKLTPSQYATELVRAGEHMMQLASKPLQLAVADTKRMNDTLAAIIGAARTRDRQRYCVSVTALAACVFGLIVSPLIVRVLPDGVRRDIAAFAMVAAPVHGAYQPIEAPVSAGSSSRLATDKRGPAIGK